MPDFKRRQYGRNHSYYLDGQKLAGVTTILGDGLAKPALVAWGINTTAGYAADHWDELAELPVSKRIETLKKAPYADRDAAARRGTEVHRLAELLAKGEEVDVPEELAGHVDSYVRFLDEHEIEPVLLETACVNISKWPYAGTFDGVLDFPRRGRRLVDIKTARSGVFPDNALQLAAYRNATHYAGPDDGWQLHDMAELEIEGCDVIHVRADGYDVVPVTTTYPVFMAFRYAQQMWSWANELSKTVVGEAIAPPLRSNA
ncbi:MAG TPA: hypothetical protein VL551_16950 [Actinospica sp.]|jgi:hypothetical protein|nr:hypothetical protein [Actinospica sp.]